MRSIALGLDLEEDFFDLNIDEQCHNLRLLSYPPIQKALLEGQGQARAGAHTGIVWFTSRSRKASPKKKYRLWHFNAPLPRLGKHSSYVYTSLTFFFRSEALKCKILTLVLLFLRRPSYVLRL